MKRFLTLIVFVSACSATPMQGPPPVAPPPDEPTDVVAELKAACDADDAASCVNLALRFERGDGVRPNQDEALTLYEKACKLGNAHACYGEGMMLLYEKNNPIRAHLLFEYTCKAKHWPSCVVLGDLHREGRLMKRDEKQALSLYKTACEGRSKRGCDQYIKAVWTGSGQLIRLQEFVTTLEGACERGHAGACVELASLHMSGVRWAGDELATDKEKARTFRSRAAQLRRVAQVADDFGTEPVKIPEGDVQTFEEATTPSPYPFKPGYIVVSGPEGAKIFVDGVSTQQVVPANVLVIEGGPHVVRLQNAQGELGKAIWVFVASGQSTEVVF